MALAPRHSMPMRGALLAISCFVTACSPISPVKPAEEAAVSTPLMTWDDLLSRRRPDPTHTVRWGQGETDVADLWLPEGPGPHPVVLMVHGGCWQKAIADRTLMNYAAEDLRNNGLAVWNVEYRGVDESGGGYPGTFLDVARAADALRDHAGQYNLKTDRIAAFGHSAGGHLALWLAARPRLPASSPLRIENPLEIAGVVNSGGLADLKASAPVTQAECLASIMGDLTGAPGPTRPDVFADTSPAEMLPLGVFQVSVNGDQDRIAPPVLGDALSARARQSGDRAEAEIIANTGHVELIAPGTEAFRRETELLKEMLR
jgi:acetyl esterase/lipase